MPDTEFDFDGTEVHTIGNVHQRLFFLSIISLSLYYMPIYLKKRDFDVIKASKFNPWLDAPAEI